MENVLIIILLYFRNWCVKKWNENENYFLKNENYFFRSDLEMEFKPLTKKVITAKCGLKIKCEFLKEGTSA